MTFDDNKLPSIQAEDSTKTLKFDNLILEDSDTNNDVNELSSGNDGGSSGNTGLEMGSSFNQSNISGGANEGSTNRTHQGNNNAKII